MDPFSGPLQTPAVYEEIAPTSSVRTVPFDYVVTFELTGETGKVHQSVINVSTVGTFVVTAIGYSLLKHERLGPVVDVIGRIDDVVPDEERLPTTPVPVVTASLPAVIVTATGPEASEGGSGESAAEEERSSAEEGPGDNGGDGNGRNRPELLILGAPNAKVQLLVDGSPFVQRGGLQLDQTGRLTLELEKLKLGEPGTLVVVDLTNGISSPTLQTDRRTADTLIVTPQFGPERPRLGASTVEVAGTPGEKLDIAVFDPVAPNVARLHGSVLLPDEGDRAGRLDIDLRDLAAPKGRSRAEKAAPQGQFGLPGAEASALRPGDIIVLRNTSNGFSTSTRVASAVLDVPLSSLPVRALRHGFRINPVVLARIENEVPIPPEELAIAFESCGFDPSDVSFLYSIVDNGTSRALQNEAIHNVAGLGIANGDRPFRTYPRPIVFEPRSVILFQVQELSGGPGTLYFVLQGYKILGTRRLRLIE